MLMAAVVQAVLSVAIFCAVSVNKSKVAAGE